ncbi:unnamed protein product, partial [Urochloa humidicola]
RLPNPHADGLLSSPIHTSMDSLSLSPTLPLAAPLLAPPLAPLKLVVVRSGSGGPQGARSGALL